MAVIEIGGEKINMRTVTTENHDADIERAMEIVQLEEKIRSEIGMKTKARGPAQDQEATVVGDTGVLSIEVVVHLLQLVEAPPTAIVNSNGHQLGLM
mmetsp:Transcript_7851/g.19235  ORF Transcript_7851/g.19235 Transcript_7851/m.19235 type:complete len:97 (-) Transcript_7851:235-525(-)